MEEKNKIENIDFNKMTDDQKFWAFVLLALISPTTKSEEVEGQG